MEQMGFTLANMVFFASSYGLVNIAFIFTVVAVILFVLAGLRGKRCRYCRKRNRAEALFCAECGHRLSGGPARPEP